MVMAIASSFGPCGRGVLVSRESGSPGILWKGSDIAREMPAPEGTAGIAPRMLKETLFAFDRDHKDGSSRLAIMAEVCLRALMREERAGTTAPHLTDTMAGLVSGMSDTLQSELRVPTNLVHVAHGSGLSDALATDLASLVAEMGADTAFDITQVNEPCFNITRTEGFTLEVKTLGNAALPALSAVNIMVADEIIRDFGSISPVLEGFANKQKALVIVCRGIEGSALATLKANQTANVVTVAAFQPAEAGPQSSDLLEDLAIATGATLVAERFGTTLGKLRPAMLGRAAAFKTSDGRANFISPGGPRGEIDARRRLLAAQAERAKYLSYDRERLERRRARLDGRWCEIELGSATAQETAMLSDRVRAAIANLQASLRHGAVAGGGAAFSKLAAHFSRPLFNASEAAAARCLRDALTAIPRNLAANCGRAQAWDAAEIPVQDSLLVTKSVIEQAVGLSSLLLRTGILIAR
jgi:chaperonin GroEL